MNTDYEYYLMQISDSFFPSGMFSVSGGLESWSKFHKIKHSSEVKDFIIQQIRFQLAPLDCIVLKDTMSAFKESDFEKIVNNDNYYFSTKLVKEVRNFSIRSGRQVLDCVITMNTDQNATNFLKKFQDEIKQGRAEGTYPVALALGLSCLGIPIQSATRMLLYTFCTSVIGSAIRLGIIGHLDGQKILSELSSEVNGIIPNLESKTIRDTWQLVPITEIFQMNHENDESKMFIT